MWRYDFHIFFLAGKAVLEGVTPYTIDGFISPYPLAVLFAPFALLPELMAYILYLAGCLWLLWKVTGKRMLWALLAFPVCFSLFVGQIDLPLAMLVTLLGPWGLPLLLVKPQVGFVLAPWIIRKTDWRRLARIVLVAFLFFLLTLLIRPTWIGEWLAAKPTVVEYTRRDSNLYWLIPASIESVVMLAGMLLVLPVGFLLKERRDSWAVVHLFAPLTNIYSASVLAEWIGPLEVILSW